MKGCDFNFGCLKLLDWLDRLCIVHVDHHVGEGSDRRPSSREGVWPPRAILTLVNTRHATAHISSPCHHVKRIMA